MAKHVRATCHTTDLKGFKVLVNIKHRSRRIITEDIEKEKRHNNGIRSNMNTRTNPTPARQKQRNGTESLVQKQEVRIKYRPENGKCDAVKTSSFR